MDREGGEGHHGARGPGSSRDRGRSRSRRRAVSEVTGVVLLFGIVMAGVALILLTSTAVQDGVQQESRMESAEVTMQELDSRLGTLSYQEPANVTSLDFSDTQDTRVGVRRDDTSVTFTLNGDSRCSATAQLGAVEYTDESGDRVAYEAGGVWRISDGNPVVVQPPDLRFRNGTLTFAAQHIEGEIRNTSTVVADKDFERSEELTRNFERDLLTDGGNPRPCMLRETLTITVESPYYEAWAEFLDGEVPGTISVDHDERTVTVLVDDSELNEFDSDGDGIVDETDNCPETYNPRQIDTDGNENGDACDDDDDGDGALDGNDNCKKRVNPDQRDADGDEVGDVCDPDIDGDAGPNTEDNCFKDYNPDQKDLDDDGLGDACDFDMDGDGAPDHEDNCPQVPNPSQNDLDDGGRGDACDPDMDGDDITNGDDNCPATPNPDQNDSDDNDVGDLCENIEEQDYDGDGVVNGEDNCPLTKNPDQRNTDRNRYDADDDDDGDACDRDNDGDGVRDGEDNCPRTYNPTQKDSDGDDTGDACENDESAVPDHDGTFVDVTGVDAGDYREVTMYVTVDTPAGRNGNLTEEDFLVYEDYRPRNVTAVEDSERSTVDVVFVFDETPSMNDTVDSMRGNVRNFTDQLAGAGVSARYGLVTVNDTVRYDQRPVLDTSQFYDAVDAIDPPEAIDRQPAGLDGVYAAANRTDWRNGTQKVIVYVGDDPSKNDRSVRETAELLEREGVTFYAVSPPARRGAGKPPARQVVDAVDGQWLNVRSAGDLDPFFEDIESDLQTRYAVTFESCKAADGQSRELAVLANDTRRGMGRANATYTAPRGLEDDECTVEGPPDTERDPEPDAGLPKVPAEGADNITDDDKPIKLTRPECNANLTPVGENDRFDDADDVLPIVNGTRACYPSELPDYHEPGDPPEPYTNVVNVNIDFVRVGDADGDD